MGSKSKGPADVLGGFTDEDDEDGDGKDGQVCNGTNEDSHADEALGDASAGEEESLPDEDGGVSPLSSESKSQKSPLSDVPSPGHRSVHPEATQTDDQEPSDREAVPSEEPVDSHSPGQGVATVTKDGPPLALSPGGSVGKGCEQICNGTSPPPSPRVTRSHKRKRGSSADSPQPADPVQDR